MPYATQSDLVARYTTKRLLLIAPLAADTSQLDADKIGLAIADAIGEVDLSVRGRYVVPLDPVPAEILSVTCVLALLKLYEGTTNVPEDVAKSAVNARALLASIRDGDAPLNATPLPSDDPVTANEDAPEFVSDPAVFTFDTLKGF
jgi:phage gp36-like protein